MDRKNILGYLEIEQGKLAIVRKPTGLDLLKSLDAQSNGGGFLSTLIARICYLNESPLTSEVVDEFDSGVSLAIQDQVFKSKALIPIEESIYPKKYELDGLKVELKEMRKIKHDNYANRMSAGNPNQTGYWLVSQLVWIENKALPEPRRDKPPDELVPIRYDDLMDMYGDYVQALQKLITPKKPKFVTLKT